MVRREKRERGRLQRVKTFAVERDVVAICFGLSNQIEAVRTSTAKRAIGGKVVTPPAKDDVDTPFQHLHRDLVFHAPAWHVRSKRGGRRVGDPARCDEACRHTALLSGL